MNLVGPVIYRTPWKLVSCVCWRIMSFHVGGAAAEQWHEITNTTYWHIPRWRHQIETFSALLALCVGNSPVTGEFPAQRPVKRSFDVFFELRLHKRLSKQSWGWWFETPSRSLWRHCNAQDGLCCHQLWNMGKRMEYPNTPKSFYTNHLPSFPASLIAIPPFLWSVLRKKHNGLFLLEG